ncbi:MAG: S-layer homology domain-containing protein [Clostridia bacterium]|nr:S-layer homology domain-containing protein [Clostridia bacterium]
MVKKKLLVLMVLAVFLVNIFGVGVAGAATTTVTIAPDGQVTVTLQFKDMESALWALKDISKMHSQDVIKGYKDGTFRPNSPIKRQEAVTMAIRLMGLEKEAVNKSVYESVYGSTYLPFADTKQIDNWAKGYVALALEKKIIDSTTGDFQPNKPATRLWVSVLLTKALGLQAEADAKKNTLLSFKDAGAIPADLVGYVAVAVEKGLVKGFPDQTFQPNKPVTRAEMAALLGRTDDRLPYDKKKAKGTVTAVDLVASTITINNDAVGTTVYGSIYGNTQTFPVDPDAKIFIADQPAELADIKVGYKVYLRLKDGVVKFLEVKAREIEGTVVAKSVYSMTIKGEAEDEDDEDENFIGEIKVTSDTRIKLEGKRKATFDDILVGDEIEAKVVKDEAIFIKIEEREDQKEKKKERKQDEDKNRGKDKNKEDDDDDEKNHQNYGKDGDNKAHGKEGKKNDNKDKD